MKTGTAILLAGAGVALVLFVTLRQKPAEKPSGWAALVPGAIDLAKWGYGEWFADEKGGDDDEI